MHVLQDGVSVRGGKEEQWRSENTKETKKGHVTAQERLNNLISPQNYTAVVLFYFKSRAPSDTKQEQKSQ